jgi:transposase
MEWTVAIGVDTHKDVHVAVALDALGAQIDSREIAATEAGYRSLLGWARGLGLAVFAVEVPAVMEPGSSGCSKRRELPSGSASVHAAKSVGVARAT